MNKSCKKQTATEVPLPNVTAKTAMTRAPMRKSRGSVYADFGFTTDEVFECAFCGRPASVQHAKSSLICHGVPITEHCPVAGLIGMCEQCVDSLSTSIREPHRIGLRPSIFDGKPYTVKGVIGWEQRTWSPPKMVQPIRSVPIFLIVRGFCNEDRLLSAIRATWQRIPTAARTQMVRHWNLPSDKELGFCKGALRIEALPNWPQRRRSFMAYCFCRGHAIRLRSLRVEAMPDDVLATLIAHELGHCYQYATDRLEQLPTRKSVEKDANEIMREWRFRPEDIELWLVMAYLERHKTRERKRAAKLGITP